MPSASFSSSRNFRRSKRKSNRNNSDPNEPPVQIPVGGAEQSNESTTSRSASTATTSSLASELASSSSATTNSSATSSNCHQSPPYDLRKKLPTTTATTATTNSGSLTESNSSSSSTSTWLGAASTSTSAAATSSCCGSSSSSQSHSSFSSLANSSNSNNNQYQVCTYDSSSQPTAKKRPRRTYSNTESTTTLSAHYLQITLPDEVLLTIFSYLSEFDLCRVPLVCKRFNSIANDCELWKRLYQEVFEYDLPLMNPEPCKFSFVKVDDSEFSNPWKESFRQLHHGIHVRPNYVDKKARSISIFNTIQSAIDYADEKNASNSSSTIVHGSAASSGSSSSNNFDMMDQENGSNNFTQESPFNLIFVHTGIYRGEFLVIDSDLKLIGAAPGNVAENIIIESESESTQSTVAFAEGAKNAYIGYMTLKFSPADVSNAVPHHKHYCLEIGENCSPTVDHCIIRSTSVGKREKKRVKESEI
jgi:F-box protein 11